MLERRSELKQQNVFMWKMQPADLIICDNYGNHHKKGHCRSFIHLLLRWTWNIYKCYDYGNDI